MANENITVGIALIDVGSGAVGYAESHSLTTDANGVFSLRIGDGAGPTTDYNTFMNTSRASSVKWFL
ncbi:hypothetical protein EGM88_04755 [Aureibaculum marinum]|uniref:Uncharacterized protein n=1 Tax=Aureibaculum marinum TaxID=2487930 RepID=A0A3N4NS48_9FLAO|nr:hypothetical protein [Aureibaculum marinum]RPD98515.1 hypothetical protein EGM88_04755 [Aureibaculum marinum]